MIRLRPGAAAFFCLLAASLVAAVVVVRARTPDLVLEETGSLPASFAPTRSDGAGGIDLTFFVRESDPDAAVRIVDAKENVVRTLAEDVELEADEEVTYRWDGRTDDGSLARPGRYRLEVELPRSDRTMIWPQRITLVPRPVATEPEAAG